MKQLDLFFQKEGIIKDVFLQNVVVRLVLLNGRIWAYYGKFGITEKYIPIGGCHLEIFETDDPEQVENELKCDPFYYNQLIETDKQGRLF